MESRFEFMNPRFPKIAGYGERAEEAFNRPTGADNNICLLYLGRIAEAITKFLRKNYHIDKKLSFTDAVNELVRLKNIDSDIARKLNAMAEVASEAVEEDYNSAMSCERLMTAAQELCEWFMLKFGESQFSFLADLFFPGRYVPPLANLAEIGREAEDNLYKNTRYCLICLGDMGEAIVDYLLSTNSIETHERDQLFRIDELFKNYVINDEIKDSLHALRMARNKAVHERYDNTYTSEDEARRLLNEVLDLCKWLFKLILKPGYIVKGRIAEMSKDSILVSIGSITAHVPANEIPFEENGSIKKSYVRGRKYVFKVVDKNSSDIILSLSQADEDYDLKLAQQYSKYKIGQDVHVLIKQISNSSGALVELKDGLPARIPPSEIGRRLYDYDKENQKQIRYEITARVKWFSQTQFPPMLLSVKDIEEEHTAEMKEETPTKWERASTPPRKKISDLDFRTLCKTATFEKILEALNNGANPNAKNRNKNTALMSAAQSNADPRVIEVLLDAGAELEARNQRGSTALHYAAMDNVPEVVELLIKKGADIEALNHEKKTPLYYAKHNKNLNDTHIIDLLTKKSEEPETEPAPQETPTPSPAQERQETETPPKNLLDVCEKGSPEEILEFINHGANVNAANRNGTTPLMSAAQHNNFEAVKTLIENSADVNAKNKTGNTPLHFAAQFNSPETVRLLIENHADVNTTNKTNNTPLHLAVGFNSPEVVLELLNAGARFDIQNNKNQTPLEIAKTKTKLQNSEALRRMLKPELQKNFLKICRSGTEAEISEALAAGVSPNTKSKDLSSALMFAARYNTAEAVDILLKAGAYIDAQNIFGNTALIYAASNNTEDVVETLLDADADIEITNISGESAYAYAKHNYKLTDTEALKKLGSRS